jgi:hypothetical protein
VHQFPVKSEIILQVVVTVVPFPEFTDKSALQDVDHIRIFVQQRFQLLQMAQDIRSGRPVEDFARYAACSAGHLRFYSAFARRRVFRSARALAALVPYTPEEWSAAVWGQYLQVIWKSLFKGRTSVAGRVRLAWRLRFFGKLEDAFRAGASQRKGAGDE